jgi:hypothetical protein
MTLVLKPRGRGNWRAVRVMLDGARHLPLMFSVGDLVSLGGVRWRICAVLP